MALPFRAVDLFYSPQRPMLQAFSGLHCPEAPTQLLPAMDATGIEKAFVTQCKQWSCERQWLCLDTRLEDVARYTSAAPERFVGLAGYNPFAVSESLREVEFAISKCGFRGVYLHAESFAVALTDRRLYPLYAKAAELAAPLVVQPDAVPSDGGVPVISQVAVIAEEFPELQLVVTLNGWPGWEAVDSLCQRRDNLWFGIVADALPRLADQVSDFLVAGPGQDRCLWGSNGVAWDKALAQVRDLALPPDIERKLLRDNAWRLFRLDLPVAHVPLPADNPLLAER